MTCGRFSLRAWTLAWTLPMRVAHYLTRNPSGLFYFRLRVPPDLWEALGARVIKRAPGTRSSRSAQAIAVLLSARYAQIFPTLLRGGASWADRRCGKAWVGTCSSGCSKY